MVKGAPYTKLIFCTPSANESSLESPFCAIEETSDRPLEYVSPPVLMSYTLTPPHTIPNVDST